MGLRLEPLRLGTLQKTEGQRSVGAEVGGGAGTVSAHPSLHTRARTAGAGGDGLISCTPGNP